MRSCESTQSFDFVTWCCGFLQVSKFLDVKLRIYAKFRFCWLALLLSSGLEGSVCEVANLCDVSILLVGAIAFFGS